MKEAAKVLAGVLLAVFLLWLVLRGVDRVALGHALRSASLPGLIAGAVIMMGHNVFRVLRWRALLEPVKPGVGFRPMFAAVMIGYLTTWVLPGRLGEVIRPALLSAREKVPLGPCLGSVVADRVLDGVAILALFAVSSFMIPLSGEAAGHAALIRTSALVMLAAITVPLVVLVGASGLRDRLDGWGAGRSGFGGWVARTLSSVAHGTEALRRPWLLAQAVFYSLLAWLAISLGTWIGVLACGPRVPFAAILMLMPLLAFGVAVPTPGGAGGYHAAMTFGLQMLFGVSRDAAVATGILMHLIVVIPVIALGLLLLRTEKIAWHDLIEVSRRVKDLGRSGSAAAGGPAEGDRP